MTDNSELKCHVCDSINIQSVDHEYKCNACGIKFTKISNEQISRQIENGQELRRLGKFEEAISHFKRIKDQYVWHENHDRETLAYIFLELFLAENGVIFEVDDQDTNRMIPVLYSVDYKRNLDKKYHEQIKMLSPGNDVFFDNTFRIINEYKRLYLSFHKNLKPYDIFICYQARSGLNEAKHIYTTIRDEIPGLNIFFAEENDRLLDEYGPHLHYAIDTAGMMIVVSTNAQLMDESKWIKHEIRRFLNRKENEYANDLAILPIFVGEPLETIPHKLRSKQHTHILQVEKWTRQIRTFFGLTDQVKPTVDSNQTLNEPSKEFEKKAEEEPSVLKKIPESILKIEVIDDYTKEVNKATKGEIESQLKLAKGHYEGSKPYSKDLSKAIFWFLKASDNSPEANYYLGNIHYYGEGTDKNITKALEYYTKSSDLGYLKAQRKLAMMYEIGDGITKDIQKAISLYNIMASQNDAEAQYKIGGFYRNGEGLERSDDKAFGFYQSAANQNHVKAQYELAQFYEEGKIIEQNFALALSLYKKSADGKYSKAQSKTGDFYYQGKGTDIDYENALKYYQLASKQGDISARAQLGYMYLTGTGVTKDISKAVNFYTLAANDGDMISQFNLGNIYHNGDTGNKDYKKAYRWLIKSANAGHLESQKLIGFYCYHGLIGEVDLKKAAEWYKLTAKKGDVESQLIIADMYLKGEGVNQSENAAKEWLNKASNQGSETAKQKIAELTEKTTGAVDSETKVIQSTPQTSYNVSSSNLTSGLVSAYLIVLINTLIFGIVGTPFLSIFIWINAIIMPISAIVLFFNVDYEEHSLGFNVTMFIITTIILLVTVSIKTNFSWTFWQFTIGLVTLFVVYLIIAAMKDSDEYVGIGFILMVTMFVLSILLAIFKQDNYIIYFLIVPGAFIGLIMVIKYLFSDYQEGVASFYTIIAAASVIITLYGIDILSGWPWQWFSNQWVFWQIVIGLVSLIFIFTFLSALDEIEISAMILVVLNILSIILLFIFKDNYILIGLITGIPIIFGLIITAISLISDDQIGYGIFIFIMLIILSIIWMYPLEIIQKYPWQWFDNSWIFWQIVISIGSLFLIFALVSIDGEATSSVIIILISLIISLIFLFIFRDSYHLIALITGIPLVILQIIYIAVLYSDYEGDSASFNVLLLIIILIASLYGFNLIDTFPWEWFTVAL